MICRLSRLQFNSLSREIQRALRVLSQQKYCHALIRPTEALSVFRCQCDSSFVAFLSFFLSVEHLQTIALMVECPRVIRLKLKGLIKELESACEVVTCGFEISSEVVKGLVIGRSQLSGLFHLLLEQEILMNQVVRQPQRNM